jgi:ABC-type ATPase involved in cell division
MLQLEAMTLRGVGSYFRGSRLDLRPITILCGVNGSGKSTWFKVLGMLRRSLEKGMLPFAFDVNDENAYDVEFMNYAMYCDGPQGDSADRGEQERAYGPPVCVGLEFNVTQDFYLADSTPIMTSSGINDDERFMVEGRCAKGMKLRIRIAHPTTDLDSHRQSASPGLLHFVELKVNESVLQYEKRHDPSGGNCAVSDYRFVGSPRFGIFEENEFRALAAMRIVQVIRRFFAGYFHISAVRIPQAVYRVDEGAPRDSHDRRDVGADGIFASNVFEWNTTNGANAAHRDDVGAIAFEGLEKEVADGLNRLLQVDLGRHYGDEGVQARYTNCYLLGQQVPKQFSSGFHQLFPIIVQIAVMKRGELLSIENPEVHLHPDLQLAVSEYLLQKVVKTGRGIMVETHSDLIIRRIMRAILAEEDGLSQQQVSLNFSKPESTGPIGTSSVLQSFGIDNVGRLVWPEGFMDTSINESERLMDVMYGRGKRKQDEANE